MYLKVLSVSQVNDYIKKITDKDFILSNLTIKGEISNFKLHSSGHMYFSIKDEYSKLNCIMFSNYARSLNFLPKEGQKVEVKGKVSVYVKEGTYQLYCTQIKRSGEGELFEAFNNLKLKLKEEGLFDESHKKQIPFLPSRVGVVTSPTSAAVRDVIRVSRRRNPNIDLVIYPAIVQGDDAPNSICQGLNYFNKKNNVDVIIVCRGGGSIEELWAFNEEKVAYAIYNSNIPVVSGVGHETDFTIADFVSDYRASTPSAAAEVCVNNISNINEKIEKYYIFIKNYMKQRIYNEYSSLKVYNKMLRYNNPINEIYKNKKEILSYKTTLNKEIKIIMKTSVEKFHRYNNLIQAYNPYSVLQKGYSIITDENGNTLSRVEDFNEDREVEIILKNGKLRKKIID